MINYEVLSVRPFMFKLLGNMKHGLHDEIHQLSQNDPGIVPGASVAKFALRSKGRRIIARFLEPPRGSGGSNRLGNGGLAMAMVDSG